MILLPPTVRSRNLTQLTGLAASGCPAVSARAHWRLLATVPDADPQWLPYLGEQ